MTSQVQDSNEEYSEDSHYDKEDNFDKEVARTAKNAGDYFQIIDEKPTSSKEGTIKSKADGENPFN